MIIYFYLPRIYKHLKIPQLEFSDPIIIKPHISEKTMKQYHQTRI